MDFSEFLRRIGAEPRSEDAELRAAREADPRCAAAATEAERFEDRLERALRLPVNGERLADELLNNTFANDRSGAAAQAPDRNEDQSEDKREARRGSWPWLAMAAVLVLTVGVVNWLNTGSGVGADTVEEYVRDHFRHDGPKLLAMADRGLRGEDANRILTALGWQVDSDLAARIEYIKFCPTLHGRGAHMVVRGSNGLVTVIFMPDTELEQQRQLRFDDMAAELLALGSGSAAIIGPPEEDKQELAGLLQASVRPLPEPLSEPLSGRSGDA